MGEITEKSARLEPRRRKNRQRTGISVADITCPFYHRYTDKNGICCESPIPDSSCTITFPTREELVSQISLYCSGCYKMCEIYRAVMMSKYD